MRPMFAVVVLEVGIWVQIFKMGSDDKGIPGPFLVFDDWRGFLGSVPLEYAEFQWRVMTREHAVLMAELGRIGRAVH